MTQKKNTLKTFAVSKKFTIEIAIDIAASDFVDAATKREALHLSDFVSFKGDCIDYAKISGGSLWEHD